MSSESFFAPLKNPNLRMKQRILHDGDANINPAHTQQVRKAVQSVALQRIFSDEKPIQQVRGDFFDRVHAFFNGSLIIFVQIGADDQAKGLFGVGNERGETWCYLG